MSGATWVKITNMQNTETWKTGFDTYWYLHGRSGRHTEWVIRNSDHFLRITHLNCTHGERQAIKTGPVVRVETCVPHNHQESDCKSTFVVQAGGGIFSLQMSIWSWGKSEVNRPFIWFSFRCWVWGSGGALHSFCSVCMHHNLTNNHSPSSIRGILPITSFFCLLSVGVFPSHSTQLIALAC